MGLRAIITGDIINSKWILSKEKEGLYNRINELLSFLRDIKLIKRFEQFRGDSFQCELEKISDCIKVALLIKCLIKSFGEINISYNHLGNLDIKKLVSTDPLVLNKSVNVRLSIGVGTVELENENLSISDGEAFHFSGEGLDSLKNSNQQLYFKSGDNALNREMNIVIILLDALVQGYSSAQSCVVALKLLEKKEEEIALALHISQSAVNQRAKAAYWYAIENTVKKLEKQLYYGYLFYTK